MTSFSTSYFNEDSRAITAYICTVTVSPCINTPLAKELWIPFPYNIALNIANGILTILSSNQNRGIISKTIQIRTDFADECLIHLTTKLEIENNLSYILEGHKTVNTGKTSGN
jgi:hypothetical protein